MRRSRTWYLTTTPRGRRSPALVWSVTTAAGDTWQLSGLQRAALLWLTSSVGYGRHAATVTELGQAIGCSRGTASKVLRRLRSLSLIGAPRPRRGRRGGFVFWLPRAGSVRADAARRRLRWPTWANDSTPTPFGGYLTREGMRRAWAAARASDQSGGPPVAAAPRRGASPRHPRARGRPWPPRYVDQRCSRDGGRVRLVRAGFRSVDGDLAAAYAARCPRCQVPIAASVTLAMPDHGAAPIGAVLPSELAGGRGRAGGAPVTPLEERSPAEGPRALAAAAVIPELRHRRQVDRLRLDHMGYRRRVLVVPTIRPAIAGDPGGDLAHVASAAWSEALADLASITASRELEGPPDGR